MNTVYVQIIEKLNDLSQKFVETFDMDILSYLYVLAGADKKIQKSELEVINKELNKNLDENEFKKYIYFRC